jgi:glycosyltransferase involved in cell wall biosynthesis
MLKFSILIPCYNCLETLPTTLTSCLQQNNNNFEVILIDDCSKESVESIYFHFLQKFAHKNIRLKYHRNNINYGVSFSRNTAWDLAIGEYICFLDSDDIWHESKLQFIEHFLDAEKCDFLCHTYTDDKVNFFTERNISKYKIKKLGLIHLLIKNPSQSSCIVLKRSIPYRFDNTMSYCEDYDLCLRISNSHSIYRLYGEPLTLLSRPQKSVGGLSANRKKMRLGEQTAYMHFVEKNRASILLLPLLIVYSVLKHIHSEFKYYLSHL